MKSIKSITKNKSIEIQEASNSANELSAVKFETDAPAGKPASPKKAGSPKGKSPRPAHGLNLSHLVEQSASKESVLSA